MMVHSAIGVDVAALILACSLLMAASKDKAKCLFWLGFLAYGVSAYLRFGRYLGF